MSARRVDEVIEQVGLRSVAGRKAGGFALGMRQRLGIAAALLGDPFVLMLDEPFNGLDPEGIVWMRGFLASLAAQGRAVLVSSHLMGELEDIADHLLAVGRGRVVADVGVRDLLAAAAGGRVSVRTAAAARAGAVLAGAGAKVSATGPETFVVVGPTAEQVVMLLSAGGVPFAEVAAHKVSLEEAYLELTRDSLEYQGAER